MPLDAAVSEWAPRSSVINAVSRFVGKPKPRPEVRPTLSVPEVAICDELLRRLARPDRWMKGGFCDGVATLAFDSFAGRHDLQGTVNILDHGNALCLGLGDEHMHSPVVANVFLQLRWVIRFRMNDPTIGLTRFNDDRRTRHVDILSVVVETRLRFYHGWAVSVG